MVETGACVPDMAHEAVKVLKTSVQSNTWSPYIDTDKWELLMAFTLMTNSIQIPSSTEHKLKCRSVHLLKDRTVKARVS